MGVVRPSVSQALAFRTLANQFGAFRVRYAKARTMRVAERELSQVTLQMLFAAKVIRATDTALEGACGARLVLLPPYSPDFNPIENAYAKFKSLLRKAAARTLDTLDIAIADAFQAFTPQECANYFAKAGYAST